jgi:hypothetical protein
LFAWPCKCLIAIESLDSLLRFILRVLVSLSPLARILGALRIHTLILDSLESGLSLDLHIVQHVAS